MTMPTIFLFLFGVLVFVGWLCYIISQMESGDPWKASAALWLVLVANTIGIPTYAYNTRPFVEETKVVEFVGQKAVITNDDEIIRLSEVTGHSYKPGDVVKYKVYARYYGGFDFCQSWKERATDFQTVLHKAEDY